MSKHAYCNVATRFVTTLYVMSERPSDSLWLEFGQWLKQQRENARLSQGKAASRAGIDRQQWYRIESGKSGTKRDTVISIATALDLSVQEALRRAGFGSLEEPEEEGFYSGFKNLPPEKKALARRQLKAIIEALAAEEDPDTNYIDDE